MSKKKRQRQETHPQQQPADAVGLASGDGQPASGTDHGGNKNDTPERSFVRRFLDKFDELTIQRIALAVAAGLLVASWVQSYMVSRTLNETKREFAAGQQPFVTLGRKDGTVAEFVVPDDPSSTSSDSPVGLKIYLQNGGLSPALSVNIGLMTSPLNLMAINEVPSQAFTPHSEPFRYQARTVSADGGIGENASISIAPQSECVKFLPSQFSHEQWKRMIGGKEAPMIWGQLDYCDEFGRYSCRQFMLWYDWPTFTEISEGNCVDLYGLPPPAQRGDRYLFPCEQPDERQQREKRERNNLLEVVTKASEATPIPRPTASLSPTQ